jgi:hypothetical protein
MKSFTTFLLSFIFVAFSGFVLADENEYKATDKEELFGTWVNMDYQEGEDLTHAPQKLIIKSGECGLYSSIKDNDPMWTEEINITHKWTDAKGNIWYKHRWKAGGMGSGFTLSKISDSGKTLEYIYSQWEYPKELDLNSEYYRVFHRK